MDPTAPHPEGAPAGGSSNPARTPWPEELAGVLRAAGRWTARPRVRLCLIGVLLLAAGVFVGTSFWTLPLVVIGALMVVVAWVGHRLEGRFVVEWGEGGTELALRATLKPALPAPRVRDEAGEVIDGEAHTVEIDVADLRALLAAVETAEAAAATGEAAAGPGEGAAGPGEAADTLTDIRIRRAGHAARSPSP